MPPTFWRLQIDFSFESSDRIPTELENLVLRDGYMDALGKAYGMVLISQETLRQIAYIPDIEEDPSDM